MPATRSSTRSVSGKAQAQLQQEAPKSKRKATEASAENTIKKPRVTKSKAGPAVASTRPPPPLADSEQDTAVPAVLTFSFEDAKTHLINVDSRFQDIFDRLPCGPFEHLEQVHPFRSLAASILGQQISWKAARSIKHKFIRLYEQSIPELYSDYHGDFFPTPHQVANTDLALLKSAGLSARKAEYVQDLASRFADGRLSTEKLLKATDEELSEMLIAVKGIGPWTVDMFAIFSLRRPNILPVGDLGVQRGLMRWFLSLHSPTYNVTISPDKKQRKSETSARENVKIKNETWDSEDDQDNVLPTVAGSSQAVPSANDISALPPAPAKASEDPGESVLPPTMTPSVNKILKQTGKMRTAPPPLPAGLTVASLKSRMDGKKKIKGALLTPKEMEELTVSWKPYRSIGVYYMWALAEVQES